jgi:hypothetical protein
MEKFKKMSIRFFFLVLILPSCIEAENEFEFESVKKIIDKHELELVGFDKDYNQGLKLDDLSEFEIIAKSITGKHHDSSRLLSIYSKNGININDRFFLEFLNNSLENEDINELNFESISIFTK